jgi:hypothetical protein
MVITRQGFAQVVANAYAGLGFSPTEAPTMYEFPLNMFIPGSDLSPLKEHFDKIVAGLTTWKPKITKTGIIEPGDNVVVTGATFQEAVDNLNNVLAQKLWTDGLAVTPATEERVKWILTGTDLPPTQTLGTVGPRMGIATVRSVAIALAMAGGRPEYLPVVIAITQAMTSTGPTPGTNATDGDFYTQGWNATTQNTWPAIIVNGPIAKQIRLSAGYGVMGPDPQHPAAAVIGRAVRLILQNIGGGVPGLGSMKIHGPSMQTNMVMAEDEEGLPKGWDPYSVSNRGFKKGDNVVTCMMVNGIRLINNTNRDLSNESLKLVLEAVLPSGKVPAAAPARADLNSPTGLLLMPRLFPQTLKDVNGFDKAAMQKFVWDNTKISNNPKQINIVCTGGEQSGMAVWLPAGMGNDIVSKPIALPKNWDQLIKQAEKDLGPLPAW